MLESSWQSLLAVQWLQGIKGKSDKLKSRYSLPERLNKMTNAYERVDFLKKKSPESQEVFILEFFEKAILSWNFHPT